MTFIRKDRGLKLLERARQNRVEIVNAKLSRREMLKLGLLTATGSLVATAGLSSRVAYGKGGTDNITLGTPSFSPASPVCTPWVEDLPIPPVAKPVSQSEFCANPWIADPDCYYGQGNNLPYLLDTVSAPCIDNGGNPHKHQRYSEIMNKLTPNKEPLIYRQHMQATQAKWHRDMPNTDTVHLFNGCFPGHTIHAHYGQPIMIRRCNSLDPYFLGYGNPSLTTHLHNGHTPSESDGNPLFMVNPGTYRDYWYPNIAAGFDAYGNQGNGVWGDPREVMNTLWYHDHCLDFTSQNVYRGMAGFYLLFDERDSGNEQDPNPKALRLPSGEFDIPLMFHDRMFDRDGQAVFDLFALDGVLGDTFTVNGKIQPKCRVKPRKYRFRLLDIGPSRFYEFALKDSNNNIIPMMQVSEDGNLLINPVLRSTIPLGVAMRNDIVIDFSKFAGKELIIYNIAEQVNGRGPTGKILNPGIPLLKFVVDKVAVTDPSRELIAINDPLKRTPTILRDLPPITEMLSKIPGATASKYVPTRTWSFGRSNGAWDVNGRLFDETRIDATIKQGQPEIWRIVNGGGSWVHPVHIHFEEHRILKRNGVVPPVYENARKDVIYLHAGETVDIALQFRDFKGIYPMHCHNVVHEDHAMMVMFEVK